MPAESHPRTENQGLIFGAVLAYDLFACLCILLSEALSAGGLP
jgi:hypothetical protein